MDKNTLIALAVIFLLVFAFQFLYLRPRMEQQSRQAEELRRQETEQKLEEEAIAREKEEREAATLERDRLAPAREGAVPGTTPLEATEEKLVTVETDDYEVTLSTAGASVVSLKLKKYLDREEYPVDLVSFTENEILPFEVRFDRIRNLTEGDRSVYHVEALSDDSYRFFRDFTDRNGNPYRLTKIYSFTEGEYIFDVRIEVESLTVSDIILNADSIAYTLAWGPILGPVSVIKNRYNITTQEYFEAGRLHKVMRGAGGCSLRRSEARYVEISRILDWVGVSNRYFFIGIVPDQKDYVYSFDQRTQDNFYLGISRPFFKGYEFEDNFKIYAGPKDRRVLKKYGHGFESVMGGRVLKPIVIFLEWMIRGFYRLTHNYGLAIILMTVVIKIILHPLTRKSFESMRRMSTLQPKINEIRDKYKSNPAEMNKQTQQLYKREKINPMGGCLPMILQLPIFYSLYALLSGMIELRNESFLWIKDLSLPDTVATVRASIPLLSQFLGYTREGISYIDINILPFVMTATTLLQSKLTSGGQTGQQGKMMTYLFPLMFFFIFWNMPSGLVLYWTIQNIMTIGQQYYIDYRAKRRAATVPERVVPSKGSARPVKKKR